MSNLFDALRKVDGELASVAMPLIASAGGVKAVAVQAEPSQEACEASGDGAAFPRATPAIDDGVLRAEKLTLQAGSPLIAIDAKSTQATEQYRIIRTRILQHHRRTKVLLISSAGPGDGKTVSAINLASILALREARVLLVDADLRRSSIATFLGIRSSPGLGDVLAGGAPPEVAVVRAEQSPHLYVLTAGDRTENPAELLDSPRWKVLCSTLKEHFDYIVLDAPPIAAVADYELLQAVSDSVIVVVRPDHTEKSACVKALGLIPEDMLLGVIVNCASDWFLTKSRHSYDYYSSHTSKQV